MVVEPANHNAPRVEDDIMPQGPPQHKHNYYVADAAYPSPAAIKPEHSYESGNMPSSLSRKQSNSPTAAGIALAEIPTVTADTDDDIDIVDAFDTGCNRPEEAIDLTGDDNDDDLSDYIQSDVKHEHDKDEVDNGDAHSQHGLFVRENSSDEEPTRKRASFKYPGAAKPEGVSMPPKKRRRTSKNQKNSAANVLRSDQAVAADAPNLVGSLLNSNIFNDVQASTGINNEPAFSAHETRTAIQQLRKTVKTAPGKSQLKRLEQNIKFFQRRLHVNEQGGWRVNGMLSWLKIFQVDAVAEMLRREEQRERPRGGVLAYQMGLGKTVLMIATILVGRANQPSQGHTLVVVPSNILSQWAAEFEKHLAPNVLKCYVWAASKKHSRLDNLEAARAALKSFPIILTTYSDVKLSYPKMDKPPAWAQTPTEIAVWRESYFESHKGILHSIPFHRVVLDESQEIKNDSTLGAIACTAIEAKHRWYVSGTPVLNTPNEFLSYMVFFGMYGRDKDSKTMWRTEYGKETDERCSARLQQEVSKWTLRRTHADTFLGHKLITLPKARQDIIPVYMQPVEEAVYCTVFIGLLNACGLFVKKNKKGRREIES